ncbi:MAG TPA: methyltransferase [Ignavibacteria bacterium]|nr:methyltransferase [Ignavibacteria bacterium]HRF64407.1 methyltransferase [Ignavibacteria bacterium]HRJ04144.1 methyltransferase [Ignavibacteria bacterium]HRJ86117.1 methyltransferase [Ignavibacteria bacterium]
MERMNSPRKPFQGVLNIVRFNWHFYAAAIPVILFIAYIGWYFSGVVSVLHIAAAALAALSIVVSLLVSWHIYDRSNLYTLNWLDGFDIPAPKHIANINAGFDETSLLLKNKYPGAALDVFDFYDPGKHTEVSIERARKAYPPYPGTIQIDTDDPLLQRDSYDIIFLLLAIHEIRNNDERINFFRKLKGSLSANGRIIVVEHQRDPANFIAFNIGFRHFFSPKTWIENFKASGLNLIETKKLTPFLNIYNLSK